MTYILIASALVLILIFVRKYLIVSKGIKPEQAIFSGFKKSKNLLKAFHAKRPKQETESPKPGMDQTKILFTQAMTHYENGDLNEAANKLEKLLKVKPDHHSAQLKLGLIYLKKGAFDKAENIFKKLIEADDKQAVFHSNLGRALYEQKKFNEALEAYLNSINLDKTRAARFLSTAEVYRALSQPVKAEEMYKRACDIEPDNTDFLLAFAHYEAELGKKTQAKYYLRQVLKSDPNNQLAKQMMTEVD